MTTREFREEIQKSTNPEIFNSIELNLKFPHLNFSIELKGATSIHKFLTNQILGFNNIGNKLPNEFDNSKKHFEQLEKRLEQFVIRNINTDQNSLKAAWRNEQATFLQFRDIFTFNSPVTEFLIKIKEKNQQYFHGAYKYVMGNIDFNSKENLVGTLLAYEYDLKDHTEITKRRDAEKRSISILKSEFENHISETEAHLNEHLSKTKDSYANYVKDIDSFRDEKKSLFDEWFSNSKNNFTNFDENSIKRISELETLYQEKLKLEAPAKYWQVKSQKYFNDGNKARTTLIWIIAVTGIFLSIILITAPDWIFLQVFDQNVSAIVRWTLVFVALLSLIAYTIRAITKVMFSSYHLARDAEERHTLTFFI